MVFLLYPLGLLASVGFLALWFLYQERGGLERLVKPLFFISLLVYGAGLFLGSADWADKGSILFRDMIIMSVVPAGLSLLKNQNRLFLLLLAGMLIPLFFFARKSAFTLNEPSTMHEGEWELLVDLQSDFEAKDLADILEEYSLTYEPAFQVGSARGNDLREVLAIEIPQHLEAQEAEIIAALQKHPAVEWAEQNERMQLSPDISSWTPFRPERGPINDPELEKQWAREVMQIKKVHKLLNSPVSKPQKTALIAILDTGIDGQHEDLKKRYVSMNKKYDTDPVGHGTHCAGIAAAISNNKIGIASLTPDKGRVKITSIKVLSGFGGGTQRGIIQGMLEAADAGADVISMSLGGYSTDKRQQAYQEAVAYARQKGAIVVAAAGNENQDARKVTPANAPGLITVTAVDTVLGRASFANWVTDLDRPLSAPGVAIYSTTPNNTYKSYNGTSMAAPQVAGLLGIMKSIWPEMDTDQAYEILKNTGRKSAQPKETGPLIQPYEALLQTIEQRPNS
ncbi:MAG: S8 family serine peptidase [Bacteroidota bacterium]